MTDTRKSAPEAAILGLVPRRRGIYLLVRCPACREVYAAPLPVVAGLPVGQCRCSACSHILTVDPPSFQQAIDRYWPDEPVEVVSTLAEAARAEAEAWARGSLVRETLRYDGLELAPLLEDAVFPYALWAHYHTSAEERA